MAHDTLEYYFKQKFMSYFMEWTTCYSVLSSLLRKWLF